MNDANDIAIIRECAHRYAELAALPVQNERRDLWRRHNSLRPTRPLLYFRGGVCWDEMLPAERLECQDGFWRGYEMRFRRAEIQHAIGDDTMLEPWVVVRAAIETPPHVWGLEIPRHRTDDRHGTWKADPPIKRLDDLSGLAEPDHVVNEQQTAWRCQRVAEAIGDILPVVVDRSPAYQVWQGDIATQLANLRGLEQIMWDMVDHPEGLHRLLGRMRDSILRVHEQAEQAGDWRRVNSENQAMPYAEELPDPAADETPTPRKRLWCFLAAQELTLVSPEMHWEFMLAYQKPIMEQFGLSAYGCCEDLTDKIDILRRVKNLRRIAVPPRADVVKCAERIGGDYVVSWRPNPADFMCCGYDEAKIERVTRHALDAAAANGCAIDISLKDIQTVENDADRPRRCIQLLRRIAEEY